MGLACSSLPTPHLPFGFAQGRLGIMNAVAGATEPIRLGELFPLVGLFQPLYVNFVHLEHGLHYPVCFRGIFVPQQCG
jgi:hypothetical protein